MVTKEIAEKLKTVIVNCPKRIVIVVAQVDPDALGAAFGLAHIIKGLKNEHALSPIIAYAGSLAHPQNRSIINKYNLASRMTLVSDLNWSNESCAYALVDSSQLEDSRVPLPEGFNPIIIIDHHRSSNGLQGSENFRLVEDVGSASTLIYELMCALDALSPTPGMEEYLYPLIALGIYTDTKGLQGASYRDVNAYANALATFNQSELVPLTNYRMPSSHYEYMLLALQRRHIKNATLVTDVGYMLPEDGDSLSLIADELLRMDGISLVVVWGVVNNKVRVSARCNNLSTPLDAFLKKRLGEKSGAKLTPDGRGEGGGLMELDLRPWVIPETAEQVEQLVRVWFEKKFLSE